MKCHAEEDVMYVGDLVSGCDCPGYGCCKIERQGARAKAAFEELGGVMGGRNLEGGEKEGSLRVFR